MRPTLRTMALAGILTITGLAGSGTREAKAQGFGGYPVGGGGGYGAYPGVNPGIVGGYNPYGGGGYAPGAYVVPPTGYYTRGYSGYGSSYGGGGYVHHYHHTHRHHRGCGHF